MQQIPEPAVLFDRVNRDHRLRVRNGHRGARCQVHEQVFSRLCDAVTDRRIKRGDLVLLEAMGGGFTWGAVLLRW